MGWFSFQRFEGFPTHYGEQHSSASVDVLVAGLLLAFVILGISLLSLLPSYNGIRRWIFFLRVTISLIIGGIILVANFGQTWEVGRARITTPYKYGSPSEIKADLGIHIGLRGLNITLNNAETNLHGPNELEHEHINYNEHFSWEGSQGRFGFGYYAAKIARDFRQAVYQGLPLPILQLSEYFTFDGEGIRFGRHYRLAGWYSQILMWTAFPCWIISCILLGFVVRYGAIFLMAAGLFQFLAILVWYFTRNFVELQVPFEAGHDEVILKTHFGQDFYLVLANAIVCFFLGFVLLWFNALCPDQMCQFFGIDPLTIYDEYHLTKDELKKENLERRVTDEYTVESGLGDGSDEDGGVVRRKSDDQGQLVLRRRTDAASRLFQKSFKVVSPRVIQRITRRDRDMIEEEGEMNTRTPLLVTSGTRNPVYENTRTSPENFTPMSPRRVPPPPPPRHRP